VVIGTAARHRVADVLVRLGGRGRVRTCDCSGVRRADDDTQGIYPLDVAVDVLPDHPADDALPYLMLDAGHIARWRGHCLARLGDADAIDDLQRALEAMGEGRYGRAEVSLRVDLALAFEARGDAVSARRHAQLASEHAGRTGSARQRQRIATLLSA
jgi:hypothetical protein